MKLPPSAKLSTLPCCLRNARLGSTHRVALAPPSPSSSQLGLPARTSAECRKTLRRSWRGLYSGLDLAPLATPYPLELIMLSHALALRSTERGKHDSAYSPPPSSFIYSYIHRQPATVSCGEPNSGFDPYLSCPRSTPKPCRRTVRCCMRCLLSLPVKRFNVHQRTRQLSGARLQASWSELSKCAVFAPYARSVSGRSITHGHSTRCGRKKCHSRNSDQGRRRGSKPNSGRFPKPVFQQGAPSRGNNALSMGTGQPNRNQSMPSSTPLPSRTR